MSVEPLLFWAFAALIVGTALGVIFARNPVSSAMSLVACFFFLAGEYVLLWAHTIAALQVLVYAGAIMVLFLFVIMLLSLVDAGPVTAMTPSRLLGAAGALGLLGALVLALRHKPADGPVALVDPATYGTLRALGQALYTQWLFPFEAVSLLLLVAIVGAVVVAKARV